MKHVFIVNPIAGGKGPEKKLAKLNEAMAALPEELKAGHAFETYITTAPMDACDKVRQLGQTGEEVRIYACGGDGTLNECVNGAAGLANVAVTHFPCGTGNDFIKTFGDEAKRFFDLSELIQGEVRPMDLIDCNGRKSINICSIGIDARIGTDVHKYSGTPIIGGATGYVVSLIANYAKGISSEMTVHADGITLGPKINMVCICNGRYYGGGFNPVPDAMPDDGKLVVLVVSGVNRLNFLTAIMGYAKGHYDRFPQYVSRIDTTELTIETKNREVINVDGEIMRANNITLGIEPAGVNFVVPRGMRFFAGR